MTTFELLSYLRNHGVRLWVEDEQLQYRSPKGVITPELRALLVERKTEIIAFLRQVQGSKPQSLPPIPVVPRDGPLPLSFAQQRLWFLDQLTPGLPGYNIPTTVRLSGPLDAAALSQSFAALIARHEALRTTFASTAGEPQQLIAPTLHFDLPTIDLRDQAASAQAALIQQHTLEVARYAFDLSTGPLLAARLLRLADEEHLLLCTLSHSIADGWSTSVLVRDLAAFYGALCSGQPVALNPLPIQYADFAVWQRQQLQGDKLDQLLAYWKAQLSGELPVLDLPSDRPRPPFQTFNGARLNRTLPAALSAALRNLAQQEEVTLFMLLLAAFQAFLLRYSGQDDVIVGSPIANRNRRELEELIGFFVNTLVLRSDLSGNPRFRDLLRRVRETCLNAYAHQDLPFERLVEELRLPRDLSRSPLFQVLFVLQNTPQLLREAAGLTIRWQMPDLGAAKFDLTLYVHDSESELLLIFEYNTDLFSAATIERMTGHFVTLLAAIVADPRQRLSDLPLLSEAERQRLLHEWNNTARPYPPLCLPDLVAAQVVRTPDAIALQSATRTLSYQELELRSNQLAHYLRRQGLGPELPVGICMQRSPELLIALLAVLKAGAAYVPLDPDYPPARLAQICAAARPRLLLTDAEPPSTAALADPVLAARFLDTVPCLPIAADWARFASEPSAAPAGLVQPDNLAYIIYTSGSTGTPKGVAITHRSAVAFLDWVHTVFTPAQLQGVLASTSICFDLSIFELFAPLSCGGTVILAQNALHLADHPARYRVTLLNTVPSAAAALLQLKALPPSLHTVNLAGEALPLALVQALYTQTAVQQVYNLYGPSEDTTYSTSAVLPRDQAQLPPIGRPIANTQVYLLDRFLQPVPIGVPGELYLGGAGLARGYYQRPDLTAERFVPNPFVPAAATAGDWGGVPLRLYKTGDLARWHADGSLEFLGRIDQQVKLRGFRIELGEIETVLGQHPALRRALVVLREDLPGEPRLVAYIVPHDAEDAVGALQQATGSQLQAELRSFLAARLPEYMLPAAFVPLTALPLTPNGKIDRKALPAPDLSATASTASYVAPRSATEATLASMLAQLLGRERVGIYDNFFALGGHSLMATRLMSWLHETFQLDLPLRSLFETPTVAGLAEHIETIRWASQDQSALRADLDEEQLEGSL